MSTDPFPTPIPAVEGVIKVNFVEFASIPDMNGQPARMMLLVDEPGSRRIFVNDMQGPLSSVSYDGKTVTRYVDVNAPNWGVSVQAQGSERGVQSFAFHPQFAQAGTRGFGKFYTLTDTTIMEPRPDFTAVGATGNTHDTVLLEWTAKTPSAAAYDGGAPRELIRWEQPFANHNAGHLTFNPLAASGSADFGLLYIGFADGGSGGDPLNLAQNRASTFGKILRIDPLGTNSANGKYGIPAANPFVNDGNAATLGEIYAVGLRNPQRFAWDSKTGNMFVADIGQNTVEKVSLVTAGANLGWNKWEGSFTYVGREGVNLANRRGEKGMTYPVVEYRTAGSVASVQLRRDDGSDLPADRHPAIGRTAALRRQPQRRDLLRQRRQASAGRTGLDSPNSVQRQGGREAAAPVDQGKEHRPGQDTGHPRGPPLRSWTQWANLHSQQAGWHDPADRALGRAADFFNRGDVDRHGIFDPPRVAARQRDDERVHRRRERRR